MGNTISGGYSTTTANMMAAFDKLPPEGRRALANAIEDWVPQPILTRHRKGVAGYATGADIAETVAIWDKIELEKRERQRRKLFAPRSRDFKSESE